MISQIETRSGAFFVGEVLTDSIGYIHRDSTTPGMVQLQLQPTTFTVVQTSQRKKEDRVDGHPVLRSKSSTRKCTRSSRTSTWRNTSQHRDTCTWKVNYLLGPPLFFLKNRYHHTDDSPNYSWRDFVLEQCMEFMREIERT